MFCNSAAAIAGLATIAVLAGTTPSAAGYLQYHLKRNMVSSYSTSAVHSRSVPVGSIRFRVDGPTPAAATRIPVTGRITGVAVDPRRRGPQYTAKTTAKHTSPPKHFNGFVSRFPSGQRVR